MSGIEPNVDWTAASTPEKEQVGPGLTGTKAARPEQAIQRATVHVQRQVDDTSTTVMEKLLGQNSLAAHDERGNDPYNTTGRQFRR